MTYSDPTMDFLASLDDPARFTAVRGVPVMKPHTRHVPEQRLPDGRVSPARKVVVTEADLPTIAARVQRMELSGTLGRGTPGHVVPGLPETDQPPVWCYYRNPRVGTFGPNAEPAVLMDEYRKVAHATEIAENWPYRSADFYPGLVDVFGVALLKSRPWLDLGVVQYSAAPNPVFPPGRPGATRVPADPARAARRAAVAAYERDATEFAVQYGIPAGQAGHAFRVELIAHRALQLMRSRSIPLAEAERLAEAEAEAGRFDPSAYAPTR